MVSGINAVCVVASVQDDELAERMINLLKDQFSKVFDGVGHTLKVVGKYIVSTNECVCYSARPECIKWLQTVG